VPVHISGSKLICDVSTGVLRPLVSEPIFEFLSPSTKFLFLVNKPLENYFPEFCLGIPVQRCKLLGPVLH